MLHRLSWQSAWVWWALSALMAVVFSILAWQVGHDGGVAQFDRALASSLSVSMPPGLLWLLSGFTYLGGRNFLVGVAVTLTAMLLLRREWVMAVTCAVVTGGGGSFTTMLKHAFQRIRPEHVHGYAHESGWSFPSGHAGASMAVYGFACYLALRVIPEHWHRSCVIAVILLIGAIGASRMLLQVHYLSDVIAGFALNLSWLSLWMGVLAAVKKSA